MIFFLHPGRDVPAATSARAAIVSVVMGEAYEVTWARVCSPSWVSYAERIGADIVILTDRIDASDINRSPAWQKLLILDLPWAKRYERVVWLDSDIVIADHAGDILEYGGPVEKVGICRDSGRLSPSESQIYLESVLKRRFSPLHEGEAWAVAQRERYQRNATPPHDVLYNTGVMVLSPAHHAQVLKSVYGCPQVSHLYEQPHLSHRLIVLDLAHEISPRFNWGLIESIQLVVKNGLKGDETPEFIAHLMHILVRAELHNAYFLHFYAAMNLLKHYADNPLFDRPQLVA